MWRGLKSRPARILCFPFFGHSRVNIYSSVVSFLSFPSSFLHTRSSALFLDSSSPVCLFVMSSPSLSLDPDASLIRSGLFARSIAMRSGYRSAVHMKSLAVHLRLSRSVWCCRVARLSTRYMFILCPYQNA